METFWLILKFLLRELPRFLEAYRKAAKDKQYKSQLEKFDAAIESYHKASTHKAKRSAARELGE